MKDNKKITPDKKQVPPKVPPVAPSPAPLKREVPQREQLRTTIIRPTINDQNNKYEHDKEDEGPEQSEADWFTQYIAPELQLPPLSSTPVSSTPVPRVDQVRELRFAYLRADPTTGKYHIRLKGHKLKLTGLDKRETYVKEGDFTPEVLRKISPSFEEKYKQQGSTYVPNLNEQFLYQVESFKRLLGSKISNIEVIVNQ